MAKTAAATALDIAEISFSDLTLLLSLETSDDDDRRRRVLATVGTELGRGGSGLLAVAGVPRTGILRRRLLPLARRLALMDHPTRAQLLKKHGLGSDVPLKKLDRSVSSFAQLLRHSGKLHLLESMNNTEFINGELVSPEKKLTAVGSEEPNGDDIENLGELVKELGLYMMELGILVARACDIVIGEGQLEQSIADFGTAKARLIHYHSEFDNIVIRESNTKRKGLVRKVAVRPCQSCSQSSVSRSMPCIKSEHETTVITKRGNDSKDSSIQSHGGVVPLSHLWQEWHYDYGIFTVLTAPLFWHASMVEECLISQEWCPPDGHTHLQLCSRRKTFSVRCSPESFIVQVGEAADILSGGKLKSTLHAVSRPLGFADISRETFVVFLQPSWDKTLTYSGYSSDAEDESSNDKMSIRSDGSAGSCHEDVCMQEILKKIPPLSSRLKEGMTFAEFSRQTTKQYYGGGGIQQNN
uniref:Isopenicillin N synthase-like Fe(2+) 2OG dioxygenase domain-containing protein n=1 Tax=Arundo donax TaxID=35708 RepID=A0A0A9GM59_ARUDO